MSKKEMPEFSLDDIISEFSAPPKKAKPEKAAEKAPEPEAVPAEPAAQPEIPAAKEDESSAEAEETKSPAADTIRFVPITPNPKEDMDKTPVPDFEPKEEAEAAEEGAAQKEEGENLSRTQALPDLAMLSDTTVMDALPDDADSEKAQLDARKKLQLLKSKLVAGPEKRYYDLSEAGVGKLQIAIAVQAVITLLCFALALLFELDMISASRRRFLIFTQVLAMLGSALMGNELIIDSVSDLFHGKFGPNALLVAAFAACMVDGIVCLATIRVPCCGAFAMSMTFALLGRYFRRSTEISQMDTLRKAVSLIGLQRQENYRGSDAAIVRGEGELEDFWDTYGTPSAPEKKQNLFCLIALALSVVIAIMAMFFGGIAAGVQVLACCLMVSVPAGMFVTLSRPAHLLEKRLHMVGTVLCGWKGVQALKSKAIFPMTETDLFPAGTTKLNGVKFYGTRRPDDVISYTGSVIVEADNSLSPLFVKLMEDHRCAEQAVLSFTDYGAGFGGEVRGETVLVGTHDFLVSMGVEIPSGTVVAQGVYAAISGKLAAVYALNYAKMRSAAAGLISLGAVRNITPMVLSRDFMVSGDFLKEKFGVKTNRLLFPDVQEKQALLKTPRDPMADVAALATRTDLVSSVYAISGAGALDASCKMGLWLNIAASVLGLLIMAALAFVGSVNLLTPLRLMLYELVWLVPTWLITEWTRTV